MIGRTDPFCRVMRDGGDKKTLPHIPRAYAIILAASRYSPQSVAPHIVRDRTRNGRSPAVVDVAVSPDDIRVIGAVNHNGTSNDTRRMRTTRKVRGKVANIWKSARRPGAMATGLCRVDRCE